MLAGNYKSHIYSETSESRDTTYFYTEPHRTTDTTKVKLIKEPSTNTELGVH